MTFHPGVADEMVLEGVAARLRSGGLDARVIRAVGDGIGALEWRVLIDTGRGMLRAQGPSAKDVIAVLVEWGFGDELTGLLGEQ